MLNDLGRIKPPSGYHNGVWPEDIPSIYAWRDAEILWLKDNPQYIEGVKEYYSTRPVEFINHWCDTFDPRNAGSDIPARLPFQLFNRQEDLIRFLYELVKSQGADGLIEKCRAAGATWVACAFSVWLWLFWPGASVGWGSRKEALVDKIGDLDSIFEKIRMTIRGLPRFFYPKGFSERDDMSFMKVVNRESGATITGEAGDNIGRGGRNLIYFKDESAHYERPEKIEAALSENTRCQVDISSVNGLGNVFHRKRENGQEYIEGEPLSKTKVNVFVLDWREIPWMTQEWYDERKAKYDNDGMPHVFAQEVDRDYGASVQGVIIPAIWAKAAVDAHIKLGIEPDGYPVGGLDVADGGMDKNAIIWRRGIVVYHSDIWSSPDTGVTTRRAIDSAPEGAKSIQYDSIGVGSGVKSEYNRLLDVGEIPEGLTLTPWNAAAKVLDPDENIIVGDSKSPLNKDHYGNLKAQAWWNVRRKFEHTYRALNEENYTYNPEDLVSLDSSMPNLQLLIKELSQAVIKDKSKVASMKLIVDKTPEGTRSPNLADAAVMCLHPVPNAGYDWIAAL